MNIYLALTFGLPTLVQGYVVGLFALPFCCHYRFDGPVLVASWRPWFDARWNYTTTIAAFQGRASWFSHWTDWHEDVHLRQYVDMNTLAAVLAGAFSPLLGWWSFALWGSSGVLWLVPGYLTAIVRYKRPGVTWLDALYYATWWEQHAYSATKTMRDEVRDPWEDHFHRTNKKVLKNDS